MIWLKRGLILVFSVVFGFFFGALTNGGNSTDHVLLAMMFFAWGGYGLGAYIARTATTLGRRGYYTIGAIISVMFFIHEMILWPMSKCLFCP